MATLSKEAKQTLDTVMECRKKLALERDSVDAILDVLNLLESVEMTEQILKTSSISRTLRHFLVEEDIVTDQIKSKAHLILKKWKQIKGSGASKRAPQRTELPSDEVRRRVCTFLKDAFKGNNGVGEEHKLGICIEIEEAMYSTFDKNPQSKDYKNKFRTLKFNLSKNMQLRQDLLDGEVDGQALVEMSAEDLANPDKRERRRQAQEAIFNASRSDWLDANRETINKQAGIKATGGLFQCSNCKSTKTTHYQKQTRSADEPMTVFVQCTNCGKRWRC